MQVGETFIKVRPDTEGFDQELTQGVQRSSTSLGQALTAGAAVAGFQRLVDASSDLNESVNVTGLIFTESRGKIDAFAQGAAQSLGQSERAAREATATFGGLLQNMGLAESTSADLSIQLTTLASDLGSAFNKDPEEAVVALAAALRGETEPIRQFNVQLDDMSTRQEAVRLGLADTTAEVDQQGLVQGRLSLIMQQTSAVQGDFANTSEGVANAQRIAAAEAENSAAAMGDNFLPAYQGGLALVQSLARGFGALPGPIQTAVVALGVLAALRGPAGNALGAISSSAQGAVSRFREAGGGAKGLASAITPGALGVVAASAGLAIVTQAMADQARRAAEAEDRMNALADAYTEGGARAQADTLASQIVSEMPEAAEAMDAAGISARDLIDAFAAGGGDALGPLFQALQGEGVSDIMAVRLFQFVEAANDAAGASEELSGAQDANAESAEGAGEGLQTQAEALAEVADAADDARDKLDALFGVQQGLDEANVEVQASSDALTQSLRENGRTFNINTQRGRDNMAAAREAAQAIRDQTISYRANGASVAQATQNNRFLTGALRNTLAAAGLNRREIDNLINTYGRVPRSVLTALTVTGSTSGLSTLTAALQEVANAYNQVEANRASAVSGLSAAPRGGPGLDKGPAPRGRGGGDIHVNVYPRALIGTTEQLVKEIAPAIAAHIDYRRGR